MADCYYCSTTLDVGNLYDSEKHLKCQNEWEERARNGKCTFCGKPAKLADYIDPCNECGSVNAKYKNYPGPQ